MKKEKMIVEWMKVKCMDFIKEHRIDQDEDYSFSVMVIDDPEHEFHGNIHLELWWRDVEHDIIEEFYNLVLHMINDRTIHHNETNGSGNYDWQIVFEC